MEKCKWLGCLIFMFILAQQGYCIRWLSLQHSNLLWNQSLMNSNNPGRGIRSGIRSPCAIARRRYGFMKIQAKMCRKDMETMPHVQQAAIFASETCRIVFKDRRWNCSSVTTAPYLTPDLTRGTREQAYLYAISSASLTYTLARACASGALFHCTCANKPNEPPSSDFQWGGCGDNVKWGTNFAKRFIDNVEKSTVEKRNIKRDKTFDDDHELLTREEVAVINLHNNRVGRKVITEAVRIQCKCHGVSGSCNIKTCWKSLPTIQEIGRRLLHKYTNAREVERNNLMEKRLALHNNKRVSSDQLIFVSKSPDYCTKDERLGSYGTVGRQCNVTSNGPNSCRQLCCGRGYRTVVEEKIERCQCKYYDCCYVKCKICRTMTQRYECS